MAFTQKKIEAKITLANGMFEGGGNFTRISGLRTSCLIDVTGGPSCSYMSMAVFGLPLSTMNKLSNVGASYQSSYLNEIDVFAGDDESGMTLVFTGNIVTCFVDASQMPNVCLRITAQPFSFYAQKPSTAISQKGSADVGQMMQSLASEMGFGFENNDVNVKLSNPHYYGSPWQQVSQIAYDAGIEYVVERGVLVITPAGVPRKGDPVLISPQTGMRGYPQFNQATVIVTALFAPAVKYQGQVKVQSDLTSACGTWPVNRLQYELESMVPNGKWFMTLSLYTQGATTP
jgi:hypothetical protein